MITLLPDFEEKERIYWKYIEEIIHFKNIILEYDKLLLIRLKNFIENQLGSRKMQVILYLADISQKEGLNSFEIDIKGRLGTIKLSKQYTIYKNYLSDPEIKIVEKEINYLLKSTHQYCCNYFLLENIHQSISEVLSTHYFKKENIQLKQKPEEASSENEEKENTIKAKYLKLNKQRFEQTAIAFYIYYKKLKVQDPRSYTNSKIIEIAKDFGFKKPTSPQQIFFKTNKLIKGDEKTNKRELINYFGQKPNNYNNVKNYINDILHLLEPEEQKEALKDIETLKLKIN